MNLLLPSGILSRLDVHICVSLEPLKRNLRKGIRVTDFAPYTAHSDPTFKRLRLLNFDKLYKLETAKFMFQINKGNSYTTLGHECLKTKKLHRYNKRQSSGLGFSLQAISTNSKRNFLTFDGIKLWNSLPLDLKEANNKISFKNKMTHKLPFRKSDLIEYDENTSTYYKPNFPFFIFNIVFFFFFFIHCPCFF